MRRRLIQSRRCFLILKMPIKQIGKYNGYGEYILMVHIDPQHQALVVQDVSKYFQGKSETPFWQRLKLRLKGQPIPDEMKPKQINAIKNVNFAVNPGEIYGVLGPNGSGKSTLIRIISTLLIADEGTVTVFGYDTQSDEMTVKRLINRVSVDAAFFKKLSPRENLLYGARLYGVSAAEADVKAREILTRLGLRESSYTAPMEEMSRGMQQKVAIARAFLTQPILLLLDEPTTGLDPRSKREVQTFIEELRDVHNATIVLTTHDMQEAEALCERIAILDEGEIVAEDTPAGLKARVKGTDGNEATLDDVFLQLTGKHLVKEEGEDDANINAEKSADEGADTKVSTNGATESISPEEKAELAKEFVAE